MDEESGQNRKLPIKKYASKLFKDSSISAVSAIVSTGNVRRKIFRILIFLLFTAGFLYQCITFLNYVLQYPTVVNIEMEKARRYLSPAYTFCNFNSVKRSKFCAKYPSGCFEPDEKFCASYPKFCVENNTLVPKDNFSKYINGPEDVMELIHDWEDLVTSKTREYPEGPFPRIEFDGLGTAACYSLYGRVGNSLEPVYRSRSFWKRSTAFMSFDPQESEMLIPTSQPGIVFSIHSPFEPDNPFVKGIFLKPGHQYRISVEMKKEVLLPYPYKTDCLNYTELWFNANKTGPRSQEACKHKCFLDFTENCFNCTELFILYPSRVKNFCNFSNEPPSKSDKGMCRSWRKYVVPCIKACKEDCERMKYSYYSQELVIKKYTKSNGTKHSSREIIVRIQFMESEIMKIQYKPQYQQVEAFSYIGGFVGIWLGVSLVQIADVFESLFLIVRYCFKRKSIACSKNPNSELWKEAA